MANSYASFKVKDLSDCGYFISFFNSSLFTEEQLAKLLDAKSCAQHIFLAAKVTHALEISFVDGAYTVYDPNTDHRQDTFVIKCSSAISAAKTIINILGNAIDLQIASISQERIDMKPYHSLFEEKYYMDLIREEGLYIMAKYNPSELLPILMWIVKNKNVEAVLPYLITSNGSWSVVGVFACYYPEKLYELIKELAKEHLEFVIKFLTTKNEKSISPIEILCGFHERIFWEVCLFLNEKRMQMKQDVSKDFFTIWMIKMGSENNTLAAAMAMRSPDMFVKCLMQLKAPLGAILDFLKFPHSEDKNIYDILNDTNPEIFNKLSALLAEQSENYSLTNSSSFFSQKDNGNSSGTLNNSKEFKR